MKTSRILLAAIMLLSFVFSGLAFAGNVENETGYYDLDWIDIPDSAYGVKDIDLSLILKSVAADAQENGDDELAQILEMVRSIRVKSFTIDQDEANRVEDDVDKITRDLKKDGWKRLVYMKDGDQVMSVNTRYSDDDLVGLMMLSYDPEDEVAFVNVVGDLDLATLMTLVSRLDGEGLDDLLEELDGVHIRVDD